jgi:hypothetical protein
VGQTRVPRATQVSSSAFQYASLTKRDQLLIRTSADA